MNNKSILNNEPKATNPAILVSEGVFLEILAIGLAVILPVPFMLTIAVAVPAIAFFGYKHDGKRGATLVGSGALALFAVISIFAIIAAVAR